MLRQYFAAVAVMAAFLTGPAYAAEVRIGDFLFSCTTPEGKTVKPKFGDIDGVFYTDMPAQREQCLETIKRKIHGCSINTDFAVNTENERYAGCLPVFEKQAKACAAFFDKERAKCDAGSAAGTEGREGPSHAALEPKCEGMGRGAVCWKRIDGDRECRLLDNHYSPHWAVTWSGSCPGGVADGEGTLVWTNAGQSTETTGEVVDGKREGQWVERYPGGSCWTGEWSAGEKIRHSWTRC